MEPVRSPNLLPLIRSPAFKYFALTHAGLSHSPEPFCSQSQQPLYEELCLFHSLHGCGKQKPSPRSGRLPGGAKSIHCGWAALCKEVWGATSWEKAQRMPGWGCSANASAYWGISTPTHRIWDLWSNQGEGGGAADGGGELWTKPVMMILDCFYSNLPDDPGDWIGKY